jgi:ferredoxin
VNLFIHIAVPLAMGGLLWLHVSRLARPMLLPPRPLMWTIIGALTVAAIALPAALGAPASAFRLARETPTDLIAAWWLPISERLPVGAAWGLGIAFSIAIVLVPRFMRRSREGDLAPSVVDPRLCTGCNQCPQDCQWEAITMVKREDDRPSLVALVNSERCVSCGICAGSCAPMGVGPPGRTGRDQLVTLRDKVMPDLKSAEHVPIVAICCAQAPQSHAAVLRAHGARVHLVSCAGNLHTSVIERLVRSGAPGVFVAACAPRDCVNREGPKWLHERVYNEREAELKERVDKRRVGLATLAPGAMGEATAAFDRFAREISLLDQPLADEAADLDLTCDPIPVGADS